MIDAKGVAHNKTLQTQGESVHRYSLREDINNGYVTSPGCFLTEKSCKILRVLLGYRPLGVCALAKRLSFLYFSRQSIKRNFAINQPFSVTQPNFIFVGSIIDRFDSSPQ